MSIGTGPFNGSALLVWFLREIDGTNFEPGDASLTPQRSPDAIFPLRPVSGAQRIIVVCDLPPGPIRPLLRNASTNERLGNGTGTLKIRPLTEAI